MGKHILVTTGLLGRTYHLFDNDGREIALTEDSVIILAKEVLEVVKEYRQEVFYAKEHTAQ